MRGTTELSDWIIDSYISLFSLLLRDMLWDESQLSFYLTDGILRYRIVSDALTGGRESGWRDAGSVRRGHVRHLAAVQGAIDGDHSEENLNQVIVFGIT